MKRTSVWAKIKLLLAHFRINFYINIKITIVIFNTSSHGIIKPSWKLLPRDYKVHLGLLVQIPCWPPEIWPHNQVYTELSVDQEAHYTVWPKMRKNTSFFEIKNVSNLTLDFPHFGKCVVLVQSVSHYPMPLSLSNL